MTNTTKVRVSLTLDIDRDAWYDIYGVEGVAALREDVRTYVLSLVQNSAASDEGGITDVRVG